MALWASAGQAHIVYGTKTLHGLVAEADLVLRARVIASGERIGVSGEDDAARRPVVEARVLEVLKGRFEAPSVRFAQHGHGVAEFEPETEALIFLIRIERSRELSSLGRSGSLAWVSLQEHDDAYPLEPGTRAPLLAAIRSYVAAGVSGPPAPREAALREATRGLLTSGDAKLAASALRDLVASPGETLVGSEDVPALLRVIDDDGVSMGVRSALLTELQRRGLVAGAEHWLRLLAANLAKRDRIGAIRAAGASGGAAVVPRLVVLLADPDEEVAAAAASALGTSGSSVAVAPLADALFHDGSRVRMAAIRGLGRLATPRAASALRAAAESHPDSATRRRATAEVRKLEAQGEVQ